MSQCTVCRSTALETKVDFLSQPPANRFVFDNTETAQETHALALGYCADCGIIQLTKRMPIEAMRPRFDWLVYNEPEGHLDDAVENLIHLKGIDSNSRILGATYKDQSTVDRFHRLGTIDGQCLNQQDFVGFSKEPFGLESIQFALRNRNLIDQIKSQYGTADILVARHILEHSENASEFVKSIQKLLNPGGYLVMEFPDSEKLLKANNHAFIWEEHIAYFTRDTVDTFASCVGAEIAWIKQYSYPYEDSIVVALRFPDDIASQGLVKMENARLADEVLQGFSEKWAEKKIYWHNLLSQYRKAGEKVAIFGAGHLTAKFINFLGLKDLIECVVDDNPNKVGMYMPGSLLPIVPSSVLEDQDIRICISTLSPESEQKVKSRLSSYFEGGGEFLPAFTVLNNVN